MDCHLIERLTRAVIAFDGVDLYRHRPLARFDLRENRMILVQDVAVELHVRTRQRLYFDFRDLDSIIFACVRHLDVLVSLPHASPYMRVPAFPR
jgi:hypothetical protein